MDGETYELPVSFAQRRIWLLDQFDPDGVAYVVPWRVQLDGPLDRAALAGALDDVVDRHETLRTVFRVVDGQPVQVVGPGAVELSYVDLSTAADPDAEASATAVAAAREPFDLAKGPLLRAVLLRLAPERHVFVLTVHHIVADGWSFGLLFGELAACYAARLSGAPAGLVDLPVQYGDFALWQQERWAAGGYADDERYWRDVLAGAPMTLALPTDHPRPPRQSYRGARLDVAFGPDLADGLRKLAQQGGATLFMTLLAAYATVLARYTGQGDLLVGVPVAGRTRPETEHLVGLFMNTLALRVRLDDNPTFADLLERVRRATAAALAHQELPFDRLVEILQPERSLAQSPVAQVMFQLEEMPAPVAAGGLHWAPSTVDNGTAKLDLTLTMTETTTGPARDATPGDPDQSPAGLVGRLTYDVDLFTPAWVERFADCLLAVARAAVADPQARVGDVELLPAPLRDRVLREWGRGAPAGPVVDVVPLLADALRGDQPAVVAGDATLSRDETARWAGRIADLLRRHGVGPDVPVGLFLPRTAALIPAMLGVWWAGGAYVPLDPAYPAERLRLMAADSGLRVLLTDPSLADLAAGIAGPGVVVLNVSDGDAAAPPRRVDPAALAYTIFTSGSTGRPKGVSVPRGAVTALLRAFRDSLGFGESDRLVAVTTLSFDIAVLELLLPLLCGGRVVVADAGTAADGAALRRLLLASGATALQATPATWRMLVASGGIPATVHMRLCGGEALPPDLADVLTADGARAWNVYGPTETTVWSAAGPVRPAPAPVEVGPPIAGTTMYVLDAGLRPVPPGVVGEVHLGGAGVARGYHGQPGRTAERFLPDPFAETPGARLYRTGDLARWRADGRLDLLGRVDHQVKVRGFRIETGEVETVLCGHSSVAQAVVTAHDPGGLVAYVVPATVDAEVLRRHLRGHLPEYMVPAAFVPLAELPLTPNGKVDRLRLPEPVWGGDGGTTHVAPRTEVERQLTEVWTELLPTTGPIGIHDNFFTLGGHSLTATQVMARIRAVSGVQLPLRTLFANPTIADLAVVLEERKAPTAAAEPPPESLDTLTDDDLDDLLQSLLPDETA